MIPQHLPDGSTNPEWLEERRGKITASRVGKLLARTKSGWSTSRENTITAIAIERLTGVREDDYSNAAMLRGIELEAEARAAYEAYRAVLVEEVGLLIHRDHPWLGCSPDGVLDDGLLEIKCHDAMAKSLQAIRTDGKSTADEYRLQLLTQMAVTGAKWVDVAVYDPRFPAPLRLVVHRVHRDEDAISDLIGSLIEAEAEINSIVDELTKRMAA